MKLYNIFCDASCAYESPGACSGILIEDAHTKHKEFHSMIQMNGTVNTGELGAVLLGISYAIRLKLNSKEPCMFNIFSDSSTAVVGQREYIFNWMVHSYECNSPMLISLTDNEVANQIYFKLIFNCILTYNLDVHFYKQKAHVPVMYDNELMKAVKRFNRANGVSIASLGMDPKDIFIYNNFVDTTTRKLVKAFFEEGDRDNVTYDIIANTEYEKLSSSIQVPTKVYDDNGGMIHISFEEALIRYAKCIHVTEYPISLSSQRTLMNLGIINDKVYA